MRGRIRKVNIPAFTRPQAMGARGASRAGPRIGVPVSALNWLLLLAAIAGALLLLFLVIPKVVETGGRPPIPDPAAAPK